MSEKERQRKPRRESRAAVEREFEQRIIDIARVARVMAGGKRMRFRACVVIGDRRGLIGYGSGKGADVTLAVTKAVNHAKKNMRKLPIVGDGTIAHTIPIKFKAARLLLKPAPKGTGIVAGGAVRAALEISGINDIVAKIYGSKNKLNNIKALFSAFDRLIVSSQRYPAAHQPRVSEPAKTKEQSVSEIGGEQQGKS
ncbi:30S ribosomal protein S5 [Candidatus Uhrbacteria bacterium]|nr:30S ribosomal protein S5 [Candidatus Uhrbacteria bacterium]